MKNSGLLIALGLIGYGLYKFATSSSRTAFGSPLTSSGTARVPSVFGAAKPGGAPVYTPPIGPGPARAPAGGASQFDLSGIFGAAKSLWDFVTKDRGGDHYPTPEPNPPFYNPGLGESVGNSSAVRSNDRLYLPSAGSPVVDFDNYDFATSGQVSFPTNQGIDDYDTSEVGSIA